MTHATKFAVLVAACIAIGACGGRSEGASSGPPEPPATSLQEAVVMGDANAIRQHIAAGSDLNQKDSYGSSPLIVASTFGATEAAKLLIDAGADLNLANSEGSTPLHIAAFFCRLEIVQALIEAGADTTRANNAGHTALESVQGPFLAVKPIYDKLGADLGPLGLQLDYAHIEETRPRIAAMLGS